MTDLIVRLAELWTHESRTAATPAGIRWLPLGPTIIPFRYTSEGLTIIVARSWFTPLAAVLSAASAARADREIFSARLNGDSEIPPNNTAVHLSPPLRANKGTRRRHDLLVRGRRSTGLSRSDFRNDSRDDYGRKRDWTDESGYKPRLFELGVRTSILLYSREHPLCCQGL